MANSFTTNSLYVLLKPWISIMYSIFEGRKFPTKEFFKLRFYLYHPKQWVQETWKYGWTLLPRAIASFFFREILVNLSKNFYYDIFLTSPLIGLYWMIRSWIMRQRADVLAGKSFLDSNSRRTSTGADFNNSFCFEQSKIMNGTRCLKSVKLNTGSISLL